MKTVSLSGRFRNGVVQLDEKLDLPADTPVLVTILPVAHIESTEWSQLSLGNLAAAYGENEPEYSLDRVKEVNPSYERG